MLHHVFFFFIFLQLYTGRETGTMTKLMLDADESSAYQPDDEGLFPIHVAVLQCNLWFVEALLQKCPDCAQLRDTTQGRTVVHAAAIEGHSSILCWAVRFLRDKYASQLHKFASIMNMRDNEGNTALHHAVKSGSTMTVHTFIRHKEVQLNIQNNKGQTALDVAWSMRAQGVFYRLVRNLFIFFIHTH
jgi:ankyrin repeat protein